MPCLCSEQGLGAHPCPGLSIQGCLAPGTQARAPGTHPLPLQPGFPGLVERGENRHRQQRKPVPMLHRLLWQPAIPWQPGGKGGCGEGCRAGAPWQPAAIPAEPRGLRGCVCFLAPAGGRRPRLQAWRPVPWPSPQPGQQGPRAGASHLGGQAGETRLWRPEESEGCRGQGPRALFSALGALGQPPCPAGLRPI